MVVPLQGQSSRSSLLVGRSTQSRSGVYLNPHLMAEYHCRELVLTNEDDQMLTIDCPAHMVRMLVPTCEHERSGAFSITCYTGSMHDGQVLQP